MGCLGLHLPLNRAGLLLDMNAKLRMLRSSLKELEILISAGGVWDPK